MNRRRHHASIVLVAGSVLVSAGWLVSAPRSASDRESQAVEASGLKFVTPQAQRAIDRGLAFLAARQNADGSFGSGSVYPRNVAVTSLCAMAFMAGGHTPGRGRYGRNVDRAVDYVLSCARPTGYIIAEDSISHGPMYGHGFATLFLAEAYGMSPRDEVREVLKKAVNLIIAAQNREGGWRYRPESTDADISVTVCQMMALRAARNAGIFVPKETIDRAVEYVRKCQNPDGGFRYQLTRRPESLFARSAAALTALYGAGLWQGPKTAPDDVEVFTRGLAYLMRYLPRGDAIRAEGYYYYGHYYAVQATWHAGGTFWKTWYPAIRDELISRQRRDGSWPETSVCQEYTTGMACLILQMPNNYLPIFQR